MLRTIKGMFGPIGDAIKEGFLIELDENDLQILGNIIAKKKLRLSLKWGKLKSQSPERRGLDGEILGYVYNASYDDFSWRVGVSRSIIVASDHELRTRFKTRKQAMAFVDSLLERNNFILLKGSDD